MFASGSSAIRSTLRGPEQPAAVLGVATTALYLQARDVVLVVGTTDAVRLPCSVVVPRPSAEFSMRAVAPDGVVTIGRGWLRWTSGRRVIGIDVVREWQPAAVRPVVPRPDRIAELRTRIAGVDIGIETCARPDELLGLGPGLTPSGDDVLAGYVLGRRAFGRPVPALDRLERTTALSAALLEYAAAGLTVPEVAAVIAGLGAARSLEPAVDALVRIGHTSGAALATGIMVAARSPELAEGTEQVA